MNTIGHRAIALGLGVGLWLLGVPAVQACATCFGASDSKMAQGMNMGIYTLLVVLALVLGAILAAGISVVLRARRVAAEDSAAEAVEQVIVRGIPQN